MGLRSGLGVRVRVRVRACRPHRPATFFVHAPKVPPTATPECMRLQAGCMRLQAGWLGAGEQLGWCGLGVEDRPPECICLQLGWCGLAASTAC